MRAAANRNADPQPSRLAVLLLFAVAVLLAHSTVSAQSWAAGRKRPALFQIISLDATGERNWRYGSEDVAGNGLASFDTAEAQLDLRSGYAVADNDRVWIRSYVSADSQPPRSAVVFFFFDTDSNTSTGGSAAAEEIWPAFERDPTAGGYEQVVVSRADGMPLAYYRWNDKSNKFVAQNIAQNALTAEFGSERDPLGFGGNTHGYAQISLAHSSSGLTSACRSRIFVRLWNDVPSGAFGDDDLAPAACVPRENSFGDPEILHSDSCTADTDCPAAGHCREHVCLFAYVCEAAADCRADEHCENQVCVHTVDARCSDDAQCEGLVCENGACVACTDSGARACSADRLCTPSGACITPSAARVITEPNTNSDDGGVRGGAFRCSAAAGRGSQPAIGAIAMLLLALLWRTTRRRRVRLRPVGPEPRHNGGAR